MTDYLMQFGKDILEFIKPQIQAQAYWLVTGTFGLLVIVHFIKKVVKGMTAPRKIPAFVWQLTALAVGIIWMLTADFVSSSGDPKWFVKAVGLGVFLGALNVGLYDVWKWWQRRKGKNEPKH